MTATTKVTRLSAPQISETAGVLARAFHDDPWWMFVVPDDAERARLLPWFMEPGVRHCHMFGEVYATESGIQGAANWLTPGNIEFTWERIVESGIASMLEKVGAEAYGRFMSLM